MLKKIKNNFMVLCLSIFNCSENGSSINQHFVWIWFLVVVFWYGAKDRIYLVEVRFTTTTIAGMVMAQWTPEEAARPIGCSIFESALKARVDCLLWSLYWPWPRSYRIYIPEKWSFLALEWSKWPSPAFCPVRESKNRVKIFWNGFYLV